MRYNQSTLKASTVQAYARHLLMQTLELETYQPALPLRLVATVLILAACWQTSLTAACRLVKDGPSHRLVRDAACSCLPPRPRDLLQRLLDALRLSLPRSLCRGPRVAALDLHQRPYYGSGNTKGCTRRQKKASTHKSFTYATLAVLDRAGRFTVGLLPLRPHMRWTTVLTELLRQAHDLGLSLSYLMLDKDFYSAEVIDLLQKKQVPFIIPAQKKGGQGKGNRPLFEPDCPVGWHSYTWTTPLRRLDFKTKKRRKKGQLTVTVPMCVARGEKDGRPVSVVYAAWGLGKSWSAAQVAAAYRRRFGIEASYRQLGQCLARTSSRDEKYRLLLVGLALLLCNLWALLHSEVFSRDPRGERQLRLDLLRLANLVAAVAAVCAAQFGGYVDQWSIQSPLPPQFAPFLNE
jgi:putative transposase